MSSGSAAPGLPDLVVPVPDPGHTGHAPVRVWSSELDAAMAIDEAGQWLSKVAGMDVRLVYLDDPTRRGPTLTTARTAMWSRSRTGTRCCSPARSRSSRLNEWIADGKHAAEGPLPMTRFRPNVVVAGADAFAEDGWHLVRIGDVRFRVAKGCGRCVLTTVDPDTAVKGKEPLAALARHRRWDGNVWFGVNLIPDAPRAGGHLHLGDPVQILG